MDEAERREVNDPNAMCLATVDAQGMPNARMVLLKGFDDEGFVFYTNRESAKGERTGRASERGGGAALEEPAPAVPLSRPGGAGQRRRIGRLFRQPRARQPHRRLGEPAVAGAGEPISRWKRRWRSRPRDSTSATVPRPPYWGGYRIRPVEIEFWSDKPFRLHERIRYTREKPEGDWVSEALYP